MSSLKEKSRYWRSLEEYLDEPRFRTTIEREFPVAASELPQEISRRRWLQLMGASLALAGVGCRWEAEKIVPLVQRPENRTPGKPQTFATCWELDGVPRPLTVTSIDGRPIKVDGNKLYGSAGGGSSVFDQALILGLYDPDRRDSLVQLDGGRSFSRSWDDFSATISQLRTKWKENRGSTLAIVSNPSSSPTRKRLRESIDEQFPNTTWCEVEALQQPVESGGDTIELHVSDLSDCQIIVSLDCDLLGDPNRSAQRIKQFASKRDPDGEWMNRLYVAESRMTVTGANADHRLPIRTVEIGKILRKIEARLTGESEGSAPKEAESLAYEDKFVEAIFDDLRKHPEQAAIVVGPNQPVEIQERVYRINQDLNSNRYVTAISRGQSSSSIESLIKMLDSGEVEELLIIDCNLDYLFPRRSELRQSLRKATLIAHAGLYNDETSQLANWKLPLSHPLEVWGDGLSEDGDYLLAQPMISPLFDGKSGIELLGIVSGEGDSGQDLVRSTFFDRDPEADEMAWRRTLHDGFKFGERPPHRIDKAVFNSDSRKGQETIPSGFEITFATSETVYDGRFANNGWLQETPGAITKLTWDNVALVSPRDAARLEVKQGQHIRIERGSKHVEIPVFIMPGQATGSIGLTIGYGRSHSGVVGGSVDDNVAPVGVDVNPLRRSTGERFIVGDVKVEAIDRFSKLATTQDHFAIDKLGLEEIAGRIGELIRTGSLEEYEAHPDFAQHTGHHPPIESLWEEPTYEGHKWGMSIDLNKCVGCNACLVACQSENNVPVVGKDQVLVGREMHWLRIDRYFDGDPEAPSVSQQPVACHHCENAPCEQVCPVAATVHSDEGLNDMIYNRCVGTRYCANNCPYKVRRFNFFDYNEVYADESRELQQLVLNPEVTVRSRGVMEKCTYCVQRIQNSKIDAKIEGRPLIDGDVETACQQACPAQAIVFGDLNNESSQVSQLHSDPRSYGMLSELNVKPRTKYLAKIRNQHPLLAGHDSSDHADEHHAHDGRGQLGGVS